MKRLLVVYNPRSSRYADVREEALGKLSDLSGYIVGKYEVQKGNVDNNAKIFAELLKDGDIVVAAGGDATGVIAANGILKSGKDAILAVLPYGNFNDLSRTLGTSNFEDIFAKETEVRNYYPLEVQIDGKLFRYATCYVTIGMMAEAVHLYDTPKMRKTLRSASGRNVGSYTSLASWYFRNRHKKQFLPEFKLNGVLQPTKTSDYAAVNGRYMARVMKGGEDYLKPDVFRSETDRLTNFWRLFKLMIRSMFFRVPGDETTGDVLEFVGPAEIEIQAEGEYKTFTNVKKVEIRKAKKCLKVMSLQK